MATGVDPRTEPVSEEDVRPIVPTPRQGPSGVILLAALALFSLFLFLALNARRQNSPSRIVDASTAAIEAPPPLTLPPEPSLALSVPVPPSPVVIQTTAEPTPAPAVPAPVFRQPSPQIFIAPGPSLTPVIAPERPSSAANQPTLIIDTTAPDGGSDDIPAAATRNVPQADGTAAATATAATSSGRARATRFRNRATTVAQGTLIPAVLDTALDSSRPGLARAIVSRDARGFDGSRILIPRGSRLLGEYRSDAQLGQRRMLVTWTRLIRPDGATITLSSPAGDPLGRGGIGGQVDTHFWERFGGAILQSVLELGVNVATAKAAQGNVILGVPSQLGGLTGLVPQQEIAPTLRVRQGTAVTIFVARDLDFTGVENRP